MAARTETTFVHYDDPIEMADAVIADSEPVPPIYSPTSWWSYALIGLGIVIAVLLVMQLLLGAPGTEVQSGTPTAAPVVATPTAPQPGTTGVVP